MPTFSRLPAAFGLATLSVFRRIKPGRNQRVKALRVVFPPVFGFCLAEFVGKLLFFDRIMQAELAVFADDGNATRRHRRVLFCRVKLRFSTRFVVFPPTTVNCSRLVGRFKLFALLTKV